jgi:hypothetical protein
MATCPRCKGPLTEHHRCRARGWRLAFHRAQAGLVGAALGAVISSTVIAPDAFPALGLVIGGIVGLGVGEALRVDG